jgi:hypothetical protein
MRKKVVVDTDRATGKLYEVSESGGTFWVYNYGGLFVTRQGCIGKTRSLDDAVAVIKAHVSGKVRRLKIDSW